MDEALAALRREYAGAPLDEGDVESDPLAQFRRWLDDAIRAEVPLANGMTLATVGEGGQPSARVVLLKDLDERGFVFFTSYGSRKGRELADNPRAALVFWWAELDRQVRIEGAVHRVSREVSERYFRERPPASNFSAVASQQSAPVSGRSELEARVEALVAQHPEGDLPRPESWGGYRLEPASLEFWQGRPDRLHDRLRYRREESTWRLERLAP